jgi:outer membrane protein OmpA-like peptidoglycan-associated protein
MKNILFATMFILSLIALSVAQVREDSAGLRYSVAVRYPQDKETSVSMLGTENAPGVMGKAIVKRTAGRTRVKLKLEGLRNPQSLGSMYTTYILWAISPEGDADNLAEVPFYKGDVDIDVTTSLQTFSLVVTAEPYGTVKLPGPAVVAENALRKGTEGAIITSRIEYRGDPGIFYEARALPPDYHTPLLILGARRAVEVARRAGAANYADPELRQAEIHLAALEEMWTRGHRQEKQFGGMARDIMREAELARELAMERADEARLAEERAAAARDIERADRRAEAARREAEIYREQMMRAQQEVEAAKLRVAQAQNDADRAKANEDLARAQAEEARLQAQQSDREKEEARQQAQQATQEKEALQQRLYDQISVILETRREARGLVVSLSDVLFDTGQATLKPGAREKLSKLAGILLAYPGAYQMEISGYTDSTGSDELNIRLSEQRAATVHSYLLGQGIAAERIVSVKGYGELMPVATNATREGRQMNRRVEIVISDTSPASNGANR